MYALTRTDLCYSHESTIHVDFPNLYNATLEGTQSLTMLLCDFFWRSNRNHYYLLLVFVMRALATSIPMYVRVVPTKIQYKQMHYYDPYHSTMFFFFTVNNEYQVFFILGQNTTPILGNIVEPRLFHQPLVHRDPKNNWGVPFKIQVSRASRLSLSATMVDLWVVGWW